MISQMSDIQYNQGSPLRRWWSTRTFLQKRMIRFCMSMVVFMLCLPLYHLGLFGSVDGPLHPARMGESLAGMGITRTHAIVFFLSVLVIALSWNLVYNLVCYFNGSRLTCNKADEEGKVCGAKVERRKAVQKKSGAAVPQYVCERGHKRPDAHFHPLQKGTAGHSVWVVAAAFCAIVLFLS